MNHSLEKLSDEDLLEAYLLALDLKLEPSFIRLLRDEIDRRQLHMD
ncbi:sporulation histidine kinase inhibitor Sda [Paenibacillus mucilaginosus]|uniref:Sporulation inhibitor sda n=2 Tax=Paenibacillus mucilaginosus TaxID=61624 RepID=I0BNL6_9BACL|nr:sporulation histidine kinase inhibitor Sda [Paenibacillus mucilaginosus]AEI44035.1 hypothetical protein KNP414_05511 [Paenibacillus mucilaginosus KNP414]AFH63963.1 hypothetical protein B2K_25295 [Paenibacillus mucilaginosus K02]MCG7212478.1 sporulation histidine kinase inhibitor Sda [Paenibacillus mucilaginosus]WDM25486.1 sporulation histidine kinase inhibitor Sda [Paenibacillus mucilaginosus]WFA20151.1 sporulation histidine kinase inhibitor Sda [Paenibacillus mucilaginosus]